MFVAIRDCVIFQGGWRTLAEGMQALGLRHVEVAVGRELSIPAPAEPEGHCALPVADEGQARAAAWLYSEAGMAIPALFVASNLNADRLGEELEWIAAVMRSAAGMGVGVVRLDAAMSGQRTLSRERRVELFARSCRRILALTEGVPVRLAIETHGAQGTDPQWIEAVLAELPAERVGLTLDPANFYWAGLPLEGVYELVERFASRTTHLHVKNLAFGRDDRDDTRERFWRYATAVKPLYEGDIDLARIADILARHGYCGALTLEEESLAEFPPPERLDVLRRDVELLWAVAAEHPCARSEADPLEGLHHR